MTERPDHELLLAWRRGDEVSGSRLVRRHFDALYRFFRGRVDTNVADLVQQAFLAAVESHQRMPSGVEFRPWLFGIARKKLLMHLRSRRRQGAVIVEWATATDGAESGGISAAVGFREEQRLLLRGLRRLPVDLQLAMGLLYWENMSVEEIAAVFGVPPGTIKSRLHRAREMLKKHISELAPDSDTAAVTMRDLDHWAHSLRTRLLDSEQ
jgi:RNA polymerase sigma-70 factor (ECF subfamily)